MRIFLPVLCLLFWFVVIIANQTGFVSFQPTSMGTMLFVVSGAAIMIVGFVIPARSRIRRPLDLNVRRNFLLLIGGMALLSLLLQSLKWSTLFSEFQSGFSLFGASEVRILNSGGEMGATWTGALGTLSAGIPIMCGMVGFVCEKAMSRLMRYFLLGLCAGGFLFVLASGGRNGLVIGSLLIFIAKLATIKSLSELRKYWIYAIVLLFFGVVFIQIFVDRFSLVYGESIGIAEYFASKPGVEKVADLGFWYDLFGTNSVTGLCFLDYYLGHSITELDYLLSAPLPDSAPFLGEYNFFPAILLLSKFGLATSRISEILLILPNPGVYTTLLGGLYLDFGIFGSLVFVAIISTICGLCFRQFRKNGRLSALYWFSLLAVSMLMSPFYTAFPTSVFPSLVFAGVLLLFLENLGFVYRPSVSKVGRDTSVVPESPITR